MIVFSIVTEKIATLQEIERYWSLDDLLRVSATLQFKSDMMEESRKEQQRLAERKGKNGNR